MAERSSTLIDEIWTALQSSSSWEADEADYDMLFVNLEWLFATETAGCFNGWDLPPVAELAPVMETWLAGWSDYFDGLSGPEFKAERGAVIRSTFDRFRAICEKYEAQRA